MRQSITIICEVALPLSTCDGLFKICQGVKMLHIYKDLIPTHDLSQNLDNLVVILPMLVKQAFCARSQNVYSFKYLNCLSFSSCIKL